MNLIPKSNSEAVTVNVKSKDYVKQSNSMLEFVFTETSLNTKRIIAYLISTIPESQSFSLENYLKAPAADFFNKLSKGLGEKHTTEWFRKMRARTKKAIAEISETRVIKSLNQKNEIRIANIAIIPYCELIYTQNEQEFVFQFHPILKDFLLKLKNNYTTYSLEEYISLPSVYAMRMYELLAKYKDTGWRKDSIENLKVLLGCDAKYPDTKDFVRHFIEANQKALSKTSLAFTYQLEIEGSSVLVDSDTSVKGKKIVGIFFTITKSLGNSAKKTAKNQEHPENPFADFAFWKNASEHKRKKIIAIWKFGIPQSSIIKNIEILPDKEIYKLAKKFYDIQSSNEIIDKIKYRNKLFILKVAEFQLEQGITQIQLFESTSDEQKKSAEISKETPQPTLELTRQEKDGMVKVFFHLQDILGKAVGTEFISNKVVDLCTEDITRIQIVLSCRNIDELRTFIENNS